MVLSMVGGAVAVAGQTVADGSPDDATAATDVGADDTTDPTDTEDSTDDGITDAADTDSSGGSDERTTDAADAGETADDGDADVDEAAETTDETADTAEETADETADTAEETADETVDTAEETSDEAAGTADDVTSGATTGVGLPAVDGALGTPQAAGSQEGSSGAGASGQGAAAPASVAVTAGASAQAPIAEAGEGPATLRLTEEAAGDFPDNGTARLTLNDDSTVTFDTDATSATATADGADAEVADVTARTVTVDVDGVDPEANSSLALEGLRFTSDDNASVEAATWQFGDVSGTTTVTPERLEFLGFGNDLPRGADGVPGDGAKFFAQAPSDAKTEGFHAEDELLAIQIPEEYREEVSFDTSSDVQAFTREGNCEPPIIGDVVSDPLPEDVNVTENSVLVDLSCQIDREEYLMVENIRFNVTGATAEEPAEFVARLDGTHKPVNATERVFVEEGGNPVSAHAPVVEPGGTTVAADRAATAGDGDVRVDLTDDIGGMMAAGTTVTVELEDTGVTFDESQSLEVVTTSGDTAAPTVEAVDGRTVVLEVQETTEAGDSFQLRRSGDRAIRFDTGPDATDASLLVTTTPGDEDVTQSTDKVVSVDERSTDDGSGGDGSGGDGSDGNDSSGDGSDGDSSGGDDGSGDGSDGDSSGGDDGSGDGSDGDSSGGDGSSDGSGGDGSSDGSGDDGNSDGSGGDGSSDGSGGDDGSSDGSGSIGGGGAGGSGDGSGGNGSGDDSGGDGGDGDDGSSDGSGGNGSDSAGGGSAGDSGDGSDDGTGGDGGVGSTGNETATPTPTDGGSSTDTDDDSVVGSLQEIGGGGPARFVVLVIAVIAAAVLLYGSRIARR